MQRHSKPFAHVLSNNKTSQRRKGAVIPRSERWPNNMSADEFWARYSHLNWTAFDDAIRQDVARALQEGGSDERTA